MSWTGGYSAKFRHPIKCHSTQCMLSFYHLFLSKVWWEYFLGSSLKTLGISLTPHENKTSGVLSIVSHRLRRGEISFQFQEGYRYNYVACEFYFFRVRLSWNMLQLKLVDVLRSILMPLNRSISMRIFTHDCCSAKTYMCETHYSWFTKCRWSTLLSFST